MWDADFIYKYCHKMKTSHLSAITDAYIKKSDVYRVITIRCKAHN